MRAPARWTALVALVVIGVVACEPVMTVRASVRTTASCASPASTSYEGAPSVAGAEIVLQCPGRSPDRIFGRTDASGQFALLEVGALDSACSITIRKEGFAPQTFPVDEICVGSGRPRCSGGVITADLAPVTAAASPVGAP